MTQAILSRRIVNDALEIDTVMARGRVMVDHGKVAIKGTFED
jgi:hypothetical protein